jgi:hypothetical protein
MEKCQSCAIYREDLQKIQNLTEDIEFKLQEVSSAQDLEFKQAYPVATMHNSPKL